MGAMPSSTDRDRSMPATGAPDGTRSDPDFVATRVFAAPRSVVFRAFIDAEVLARWWGPAGFTNTSLEFTPEPGRMWRFVMRGPDGTDYVMENEFVEVVDEQAIVLLHPQPTHNFRLEMTYLDEGGKTRLTWRMWFESAAEAERVKPYIDQANEQNFDRLAAELDASR
jgi:uncharacterized protein YndB with AHSA1/START domain